MSTVSELLAKNKINLVGTLTLCVDCYIWYSDEGMWVQGRVLISRGFAVPNVTVHLSCTNNHIAL